MKKFCENNNLTRFFAGFGEIFKKWRFTESKFNCFWAPKVQQWSQNFKEISWNQILESKQLDFGRFYCWRFDERNSNLIQEFSYIKVQPWTLVVYQGLIYLLKEVKLAASQQAPGHFLSTNFWQQVTWVLFFNFCSHGLLRSQ